MNLILFRASDIVKISLIPSHNSANVNISIQSNPSNNDDHTISKNNFNKESKMANKYVYFKTIFVSFDFKQMINFRSPPNHQKGKKTSKSPLNLTCGNFKVPMSKSPFGNLIPAKVEVKLAQPGTSSLNNNSYNHNVLTYAKNNQQPQQRNVSMPIDIANNQLNIQTYNNVGQPPPPQQQQPQQLSHRAEKKKIAQNRRHEQDLTFCTPIDDPEMDTEFDFEKNLALFNKRALWKEIDAKKPDVVNT